MEITPDPFLQVPKEILLTIYDYLLPNDLSRACVVCRKWNLVAGVDELWRKFVYTKKINKNIGSNSKNNNTENKPLKWIYVVRKILILRHS